MSELLKLDHIQKYYGNEGAITKAINDISFSVEHGEFLGIMGASGSGKTTLLNCISTIDTVSAGHIHLDGADVTKIKPKALARFRRENLGFIFQDFNLLDTLTISENIALALTINRLSEQAVQEAIRTIKDGGVLQNQTVKFYRSRYRCNAFSIVNYLMRKYGVNVPLRTQGWINEKLTSVTIENGKCEHLRYMRAKGAQCSQRFFDCMSELIHNVCAETEG